MSDSMKTVGDRIRARRAELGLSQPQLAQQAGALTYQAIQAIERGGATKHILALAKALKVNPNWLETGTGPKEEIIIPAHSSTNSRPKLGDMEPRGGNTRPENRVTNVYSEALIKVLGMAECGAEGWATWEGEVVDWVPRPPNLAGAKDAYAVFILGNSMEARYHPGEVAFIHPGKPVTPGSYVLVQKRPKVEGDSPLAVIKRLVKRSGDKVILEQLNPPKTITLLASEIVSMHRVVGSAEA